jgi:UDPglucose 6-dehydrogenase
MTKEKLGNLSSKKITILGTAFKPNTDDIRDSIAIELIKKLLKKKAKITIHDPKAMKNTKRIFEEKINYAETMKDALSKSECVIIMTQWKQYEKLNNNEFDYMKRKFIIDCKRILAKKQLDVDYYAIGLGR